MDDLYIQKVCNGDQEAFRYFVRTYKDMAFNIAMSVLKDEFGAQEVVQEAFIKAYKGIRLFKGKSAFSTWFYRIVTNEALMRLRKSKKDIVSFTSDYPDETFDDSFLQHMDANEQSFVINSALARLSTNESLALRLFYLQEENVRNVSEITGWSEGSTKIILHRARKHMFVILSELLKENTPK